VIVPDRWRRLPGLIEACRPRRNVATLQEAWRTGSSTRAKRDPLTREDSADRTRDRCSKQPHRQRPGRVRMNADRPGEILPTVAVLPPRMRTDRRHTGRWCRCARHGETATTTGTCLGRSSVGASGRLHTGCWGGPRFLNRPMSASSAPVRNHPDFGASAAPQVYKTVCQRAKHDLCRPAYGARRARRSRLSRPAAALRIH
jgi:hypothetical protein